MSLCLIDAHGDIEGDFDLVVDLPRNVTRKEVHKLIFGIDPPELLSPYCACACNCEECKHKDDPNCDVNWWNAPYTKCDNDHDCEHCDWVECPEMKGE